MMKTYDSYKDSGIEWIGELPRHWEVMKTNHLTYNLDGLRIPLNSEERSDIQGDIPYWGSNGIVDYVNKYTINEEIILVGEDGSPFFDQFKDVSFYVNQPVWVNNHIHVLKTKENIYPRFLTHSFNCVDYKEYITGSTRDKLTQSDLKRIKHCVPPLTEQEQIVSYLDEKTSLIDEMVEKKKRKIELLKEYRTSLINTVVTKGLNPDVPMKDTGIEWIGEIPKHWELKRLKYISEIIPSNVDKHIFEDEIQVELCNYTDVYKNDKVDSNTILSKGSCNTSEYEKYHVKLNDVIITKDSESPDDIGIPCLISEQLQNVVCGYHLTMLRPTSVDGRYLFRYLLSNFTKSYFFVSSNGMTRYGLGKSSIEDLFTTLPPISEQEQIVSYLDEKTSEIDKTIELEKKKIELLKEYRQSLISNVVTGKIKVV